MAWFYGRVKDTDLKRMVDDSIHRQSNGEFGMVGFGTFFPIPLILKATSFTTKNANAKMHAWCP